MKVLVRVRIHGVKAGAEEEVIVRIDKPPSGELGRHKGVNLVLGERLPSVIGLVPPEEATTGIIVAGNDSILSDQSSILVVLIWLAGRGVDVPSRL